MNVYDVAHNLARAIKNSNEYKDYKEKSKKVFDNPKTREMVEDFRKKAMEIQIAQMNGKKVEEDKINQLKKLQGILVDNPVINDFFTSEMRFTQMMNDIYKIIGESIEADLGFNDSK